MERDGLVVRERSRVDERSVIVRLAPRGEELRGHAHDVQCRIGEAFALEPAEVGTLRDLLRTVTSHLVPAP